jgi:hypothetical protein
MKRSILVHEGPPVPLERRRVLRRGVLRVVLGFVGAVTIGIPAVTGAGDFAFVTTTDYITGNASAVESQQPYAVSCNVHSLHSDAVSRYFDPYIYVLNRKGADNVQILDPNDGFSTIRQFSVGAGSDPHDIVVLSPTKAYVTRYDTNSIWIVDPSLGVQTGSIDLSTLADGDGLAEIDMMCRVGERVFVTVQRLDRDHYWGPSGTSYVAAIDALTDTPIDADPSTPGVQPITLTGANPYSDLQLDPYTGKLYVACAGFWGLQDGGVEVIDPVALESEGFIFLETTAQGDFIDVEIDLGTKGFAIVMDANFYTVLISFDAGTGTKIQTLYAPGAYVLQDIEVSPHKELFLADRTPTQPGVRIYDVYTNDEITAAPVDVCLPPFDICFGQPMQTGIGDPPGASVAVSLEPPHPNPFNPATTIPFTLAKPGRARLAVYNALGQRIRVLFDGDRPAGRQVVTWDGRDDAGRHASSGVYFVELRTGGSILGGKVVVAR